MNYGIPYMGSKSKLAKQIIEILPDGNRLVDLFGGGFAISHCALKGEKYSQVYYNELNPLLPDLLKRAMAGEFSKEMPFISSDEFRAKKDLDGYIKYIWSFGNKGKNYLFAKRIEKIKEQGHNYCVYGCPVKGLEEIEVIDGTPKERRLHLKKECQKRIKNIIEIEKVERLERLEQLQRLERLQQLERLERLEVNCGDYRDYVYCDGDVVYCDGDVVYCDPPYEGVQGYGDEFNHQEFYKWVHSRPYGVFFSSYEISDDRFKIVWQRERTSSLGAGNNNKRIEHLYWNGKGECVKS